MRKLVIFPVIIILLCAAIPAFAQESTGVGEEVPLVIAPELFLQAGQAMQSENYGRALLDYSLYILLNPTDSQGFYGRALTYGQVGELDAALSDLNRAANFAPDAPAYTSRVIFERANVYIQQNKVDAALADLDTAIGLNPANTDALLIRGNVLAFQERFADALADYDSVIALQPDHNRVYGQRGTVNLQLGNLDDALSDFNQAIELDPANVQPYINRALLYNSRFEYDSALDDLDRALNLTPENSRLYLFRASINISAENVRDAASDYLQWMDNISTREIISFDHLGSSQPLVIEMEPGWVYSFPFDATEGQMLNIAATRVANGGDADPLVVVVDADRNALVGDDDGGGNLDAMIENYVIPADGEYTLIVSHAMGGGSGQIGVRLNLTQ